MSFIRIAEYNNWSIDYDDYTKMYCISYFKNNHFQDLCLFFAYDENKSYTTLKEVENE